MQTKYPKVLYRAGAIITSHSANVLNTTALVVNCVYIYRNTNYLQYMDSFVRSNS